jgi:hypothetical protein
MSRPTVVLDLAGKHELARDLVAGGVFVPGCTLELNVECELVVRSGDDEVRAHALVVFANAAGAGLQLINCDAELKQRIAALASPPEPQAEVPAEEPAAEAAEPAEQDDKERDALPKNVHERLRGLTLAQQLKLAHTGEVSERMVLERLYGKNVWEALLRNPRLTGPEVARIARMGALPRPLVEIIVGNGAWLQIPEVRRALLSNPRLGADQITKVLRLMPKHELKLAAMQTVYPMAVRDVARRILKESGG